MKMKFIFVDSEKIGFGLITSLLDRKFSNKLIHDAYELTIQGVHKVHSQYGPDSNVKLTYNTKICT